MIVETAYMDIVPGQEEDFEAVFDKARHVVAQSPGFQEIHLHRGVERPSTYLVMIGWDTVSDHMDTFRNSELFVQWRGLLGPYFANPPQVEHWNQLHL